MSGLFLLLADLDPRWVKRLIATQQFDQARAYMDHVVDQAPTILKHRQVSALFYDPKITEALADRRDLVKSGIKGVFVGGLPWISNMPVF